MLCVQSRHSYILKQGREALAVIFTSTSVNHHITSLSSLKLSQVLEQQCPKCILEIRYNTRLNVVAVDTRNGQTSRTSLSCSRFCRMPVRAHEPISWSATSGIIRNVDYDLSEAEITANLQSPQHQIARARRLGKTPSVKLTFYGSAIPDYVLLGHVRHPVFPFQDRPLQCHECLK